MIDEKKLLNEIKKLYAENSQIIEDTIDDNSYYLGKNMAYIEVNSIIKDLLNNSNM